jgi:tripartite ATP-independent transporter DctP family solute receptor
MKKTMTIKMLGVLLSLIVVICLAAPVYAEEPIELSLYWALGRKALQWSALTRFMDGVEASSKGRVKFKRFCCKAMGSSTGSIESVRGGSLDITTSGVGSFGKYDPSINMLVMPYLFEDYDHAARVMSSDLWTEMVNGLEKYNLKPLINLNAGFRDLLTVDKPVHNVADLKGIKVKTSNVKPFRVAWELLGAIATPMKTSEQYMAMKTGVVKGVEMPPTNILATKLYEVAKFYSPVRVCWLGPLVVMNLKKWNSLPSDIKDILITEARNAAKWSFDEGAKRNASDLEILKSKYGVKEQSVNIEEFKKVAEKTYEILSSEDWYKQEIIDKLRSM